MGESGPVLAVIGGGAMAHAILEGAEASGRLTGRVCVAEPDEDRRAGFSCAVASAGEAMRWLAEHEDEPGVGQVMLAVKPQMLDAVAAEVRGLVGGRVVISILAGIRGERVRSELGGRCRVIRVMPNTPAQIGRGTTAVSVSAGACEDDAAFALSLFRGVGDVVVRIDEALMDGFTAVAGSGPAYVFYLAEAMQRGAEAVGFDPAMAREIVTETILGAAELLKRDGSSANELRARVTSKKGTTQAATDSFDASGVADSIVRGIIAARDRGIELGRE